MKNKINYGEALQKSNLFYKAQRSGDLPKNNPLPWRGDSALKDGADVGRDLTGGYYDAGDHVKFGFPMAASMTMLSWGVEEYRDGYKKVGQLDETLDNIKWGTDYLLKAYDDKGTATTKDDVFWGQVGDGKADHDFWGAPEDMKMARPSFKITAKNPGSDLAGESAAALASASIVFRPTNKAYADKLLNKAKQLYDFADQHQGTYSNSIPAAKPFYTSRSGYKDELAWGAAWVHKAIKAAGKSDTKYLEKAEKYQGGIGWTHDWDNKSPGTGILLAQETGKDKYKRGVENWLDNWAKPNGSIKKTSGGLAWLSRWASLRYSANTAFLAGVYGDTVKDKGGLYTKFSEKQIDYILGDNPKNFSYMVGFGENSPKNPHHRAASGTRNISDSNPNKHVLYGALVGGPTAPNDNAYQDKRTDFIANEVALDYNAAFTGALARMTKEFGGNALSKIPGTNLKGGGSNPIEPAIAKEPDPIKPAVPNEPDPIKPAVPNEPNGGGKPTTPVDSLNPSGGANNIQEDVNLSVVHKWDDGFIGNVKITNEGKESINNWELEFKAPFEIKEIWNGSIESHQGKQYVVQNAAWNPSIAPGQSVSFGFKASTSGDMNLALSGAELNRVI
ncbi:MAG: glycoside hydrolase family 9 protein [Cyanobacteria bacterium P01_A01_bin.84]